MLNHPFELDDDTVAFLRIVRWCLVRYFGHSDESAQSAIDLFIGTLADADSIEWLHHDGVFLSSLRVHHQQDLGGDWDEFTEWRVANGYSDTPAEVQEYFNSHYFQ